MKKKNDKSSVLLNRDKSIDIARGISILLVLAGHCQYIDLDFKIWIYSFHMPLFFFLSGMVFSYDKYPSWRMFLKNKVKKLIIPYFTLGILIIILSILYNCYITRVYSINSFFSLLTEYFKNLLLGNRLHENYYSFWFIPTLFVSVVLFYFVAKIIDKKKNKFLLLMVFAIICYVIQVLLFKIVKGFYWSLDLVPIALTFISFGYIFKNVDDKIKNKVLSFDYVYILIVVSVVLSYINYHYFGIPDLFYCKLGSYYIFILTALLGIWIIMLVSKRISFSKIMEYIGMNSFIFYFFHSTLVFPICDYILWKVGKIINIIFSNNALFWMQICISTLMLIVISFLINKYMPFLVGRRRIK